MGGKSDSNDSAMQQQLPQQPLTSTTPLDLSREMAPVTAPTPGRLPTQPPPPPATSTGDIVASTLSVPDFMLEKSPLQPQPPPKRSKLTTTDERGRVRQGSV